MSTKNARILGIRLDEKTNARLLVFESATLIEGVSLARAALIASLDAFDQHGTLTLPLRITDASQSHPFLHGQTRQNPLEFPACTPPTFATPAPSIGIFPTKKPPLETASIAMLPPPPVLSSLNDRPTAEPAPTEQRSEPSYSKPNPKRKAR